MSHSAPYHLVMVKGTKNKKMQTMHTQNVILRIPIIGLIIPENKNFYFVNVPIYNCQEEFRQSSARFLHCISGAEVMHSHS